MGQSMRFVKYYLIPFLCSWASGSVQKEECSDDCVTAFLHECVDTLLPEHNATTACATCVNAIGTSSWWGANSTVGGSSCFSNCTADLDSTECLKRIGIGNVSSCVSDGAADVHQFAVAGVERCFSRFQPSRSAAALEAMPVVVVIEGQHAVQCARSDRGWMQWAQEAEVVLICLAAAPGGWMFGNGGVVHDNNANPCDLWDSLDVQYMEHVFAVVNGDPTVHNPDKVFVVGHGEGGDFAQYVTFCSAQHGGAWGDRAVAGLATLASGLKLKADGVSNNRSFADCDKCQYFPAKPVEVVPPLTACLYHSKDDVVAPIQLANQLRSALKAAGSSATLHTFDSLGHEITVAKIPTLPWDIATCLGITAPDQAVGDEPNLAGPMYAAAQRQQQLLFAAAVCLVGLVL
mmetsp:Transcript_66519/g.177440  ORF Transcript_66519/g.177440 Transcript_66519/m.177440 type:complete len:404 (-) Transcript_66519:6-1217(-)